MVGKLIGFHVRKSDIPRIYSSLRRQGYSGLSSVKDGRYYNIFYKKFKKRK